MPGITAAVVGTAAVGTQIYSANKASDAAEEAARLQANSANQAAANTQQAQDQFRSDLAPFRQAGEAAIPLLQQYATESGEDRVARLESDPLFQAALNSRNRDTLGAAATQGRIGTGDFSQQISENFLLSASPILQQQEQSLLNLANIGQSSAAQTGVSGLQAAQAAGNYGIDAAEAIGAGNIASTQIDAQRNQAVLGGLTSVLGGFV